MLTMLLTLLSRVIQTIKEQVRVKRRFAEKGLFKTQTLDSPFNQETWR